jgi:hypothetical protein
MSLPSSVRHPLNLFGILQSLGGVRSQLDAIVKARFGFWSCENDSAEGERRRHLNLACCPNCELESRWLARSAVSDLVVPMDTPTPHVWIAAMRGFTPRMFMARARL